MASWWWIVLVIVALVGGGIAWRFRRRSPPALPVETPSLPPPAGGPAPPPAPSLADRFARALARTREAVADSFASVFGRGRVDAGAWEALEEALIRADVGAKTSLALVEELRASVPAGAPAASLAPALVDRIRGRLERLAKPLATVDSGPLVVLVVGVNGSGKTTTIGKLAHRYRSEGRTVVLGAGDTFRAGAIDQLKVWGERAGVPVVAHQEGADPAAVCHDAVQSAIARRVDVVILDTAGRLQAHQPLMEELAKVRRVVGRLVPGAPHEVLLVLDATMGQNALSQARIFGKVAGVTGIVLTKLDGTAKGGVVLAIAEELGLPVKLVGLGEKIDDLRDFDSAAFASALIPSGTN